jgi:DNA-binding FrmR family transcriptional regulator
VAIEDVIGGSPHSSPRGTAVNDSMTKMLGGQVQTTYGYVAHKDSYAKRLRRIEGQVRGIAKMIDDDKYCIDILTQISAASSALRSVALNLLDDHLDNCVSQALAQGGDEADVKLAEASAAIARLVRS